MYSRKLNPNSDFEAMWLPGSLRADFPSSELPEKFASNPNTKVPIAPTLISAIANGASFEDPPVILKNDELVKLIERALNEMPDHPFHNRHHIERVVSKLNTLLGEGLKIRDEDGNSREITEWERQAIIIGAAFHDIGHSGTQYRQLSNEITLSEGRLFSNEENAAMRVDEILEVLGFSISQRLTIQGLILGTTFAQSSKEILPKVVMEDDIATQQILRGYSPQTDLEKIVSYLDVAVFDIEFEDFLVDYINVALEFDPLSIAKNSDEWKKSAESFLNFVRDRLYLVEGIIPVDTFIKHTRNITSLSDRIKFDDISESMIARIEKALSSKKR